MRWGLHAAQREGLDLPPGLDQNSWRFGLRRMFLGYAVGRLLVAWLLLPQSFMNASGRAVQMLAGFFKIKPEEMLVVHDELDFAPGTAKLKQGGGIAGHNGLRDISQRLASHDYWRLRIGVGKPPAGGEGADYVLQKPPAEERTAIDASIAKALEVLPLCLSGDMQGAMTKLHTEEKKPVETPKEEAKPAGLLKSLFGKK